MKELYKNLGIEANPSMAYHPQTDGQTERVNQELEEYLQIYINQKQNDWVDWLPIVQFCHNDRQDLATRYSPFMVTGGRHPFKGRETGKLITNQLVKEYIKKFKETWKITKENLEKAAEWMKKQHDKKVVPSRQYKPGDRVYLDASKIKTTQASKKLDAKFHGPFKVLAVVGKSAYRLELPSTWQIHDVFHESKLKPASEPIFPIQKDTRPHPPPKIINGEEEHEVTEVIGVTTHGLNIMHSGHVGPPGTISFYLSSFHSTLTPVLLVRYISISLSTHPMPFPFAQILYTRYPSPY